MKIFDKVQFWFSINRYAILLEIISQVLFISELVMSNLYFQIAFAVIGLSTAYYGFVIFSNYNQKVRAVHILSRRNQKSYSEQSFVEYLGSPCGRVVVKTVLKKIGMIEKYKSLKSSHRIALFTPQKDVIKIYSNSVDQNTELESLR